MLFKNYLLLTFFAVFSFAGISQLALDVKDYPITPIPFSEVSFTDDFWAPKIKTNHLVTIPIAIEQSEKTGRIDNFKIAGGLMEGSFCSIYPFDDSDIYKIIEAASYSLQSFPDQQLEVKIDSLIEYIKSAQEVDGYLYTNRTIEESTGKLHPWAGEKRWVLVNELSHELYNVGHMYEAAVAHYYATDKRSLLDIAIKNADLVCKTFGPGKVENYPGHQEIEIGLIKLYRITGKPEYLETAKYFLDARGNPEIGRPDTYNQSHVKVTEQTEAVGHSVRAAYMWSGMADVAAITGNKDYVKAITTLWHDIVDTKLYINGGIGATGSHEGFGDPYELPNLTAYCETCAGVGNAMWNHRMFLMTGDAKFIDVLERTMYNNILTGVSFSGDRFFYPNPLRSHGQHDRSEWFGCACCPPNVARFLPSMPGYVYAKQEDTVFVNLFISSESSINLSGGELTIRQNSSLPWEGHVKIELKNSLPVYSELRLRIPGWAMDQPVPGDLYTYSSVMDGDIKIRMNGMLIDEAEYKKGFLCLSGEWSDGDIIEIDLPVEAKIVNANSNIEENRQKIAVERGPLVYCAEWADNGERSILNTVVNKDMTLSSTWEEDFFGGVVTLEGMARNAEWVESGELHLSNERKLKLIPYFLWNNRGPGQMRIWLPTSLKSTIPAPNATIAYRSKLTSSKDSSTVYSIVDQVEPKNSNDKSNPFFHWWPNKDTWEWVQFDFEETEKISSVKAYWLDDRPKGGTRIPDGWEIYFLEGEEWKEVNYQDKDEVEMDKWNTVQFKSVETKGIQLKIRLNKDFAAGIHEIIIK